MPSSGAQPRPRRSGRISPPVSILATVLLAAAAHAQDSGRGERFLEEIIVVATKRPEPLQDIPVAVTAVTGEALERSGVEDVYDLQEQAPSLTVSRSQNATVASFAIRGIGTSSQNFGLESSVGLYVDGVYRARQSSIVNNLVDIEAVEVLRGPQGTLFGKNTPSGAINMRTVMPAAADGRAANDANAFVEATAGDYGLFNLSGASNIPLIDDVLALRATAFSSRRDGYVSDVGLGSDVINDLDRRGGRLQLYYTPTDRFSLRVIADYAEIDEVCCAALTRRDNIFASERTGPLGQPVPGTDFVLRTLFGATTFTGEAFEDRSMALNRLPRSTNEDRGLSAEIGYALGNATLTSITAYRAFDTTDEIDADFSDAALFTKRNSAEQSSLSQELRLTGTIGERLSYVGGLYWFSQDLDADNVLTTGADFADFFVGDCLLYQLGGQQPGTEPATSQGQLACLVDGIAAATAGVPGPPFGPGPLAPAADAFSDGGFAREVMLQEHTSWAVFGQVDFSLTDAWRLTLGLRYTQEDKDLNGRYFENPLGAPPDLDAIAAESALFLSNPAAYNPYTPASLAAFGPVRETGWGAWLLDVTRPRPPTNVSLDDEQVSGTARIAWHASDSMMFYASYATGYKSGGTNTDRINPAFSAVFDAETSEAIEVGMKADFENARLNVALHDTQVEDLQANSFTGLGFNLQNAGEADTHGAEVELWWVPADAVNVQLAYTWSVADFDRFLNGTCWVATPFHTGRPDPGQTDPDLPVCDRSGDRVPSNPEQNVFLAASFHWPLTDSTRLFIRPEINYYSDDMTDGNNDPLKLKDAYEIYNLRVGLEFVEWDASVVLWGRNLSDEADYETVFDVPIQDGKLNAYPREPRTWGVTFRKGFD